MIEIRRACAAVLGLCVWSHLTSGASVRPENDVAYSTGNESQNICGDFSETAPLQRYTASCVVGYCSEIPRTFSTAKPSKGLKNANNKLNSTLNTTRCKAASFFLFSPQSEFTHAQLHMINKDPDCSQCCCSWRQACGCDSFASHSLYSSFLYTAINV